MPVRQHITWGGTNPFSDPRLENFERMVIDFRAGRLPAGWAGNKVWENRWGDLPVRDPGYYHEFYVGTSAVSGDLRVVLGRGGDVYVSGDHHDTWRQVIEFPQTFCNW